MVTNEEVLHGTLCISRMTGYATSIVIDFTDPVDKVRVRIECKPEAFALALTALQTDDVACVIRRRKTDGN